MDCSLGIAAILTLLFLGVIFFCAYRFLKKKRQNQKAEKNKKIAEDEKILIEEAEDIDILEDPIEVGFFFNLMLIKHLLFSIKIIIYRLFGCNALTLMPFKASTCDFTCCAILTDNCDN